MARHMVFPCGWTPEGHRKASQCLTWLCTSIICNWWKCLQCSTVATCCWALEIWIKYGGEFWVFVLFICKIWIYICLAATHIVSTVKLQLLKGWGCDCTHLLCTVSYPSYKYHVCFPSHFYLISACSVHIPSSFYLTWAFHSFTNTSTLWILTVLQLPTSIYFPFVFLNYSNTNLCSYHISPQV